MSDRKYRHSGYQDDDRRDDRRQRPTQPHGGGGANRFQDGPRGRGLGTPTVVTFKCAHCGREDKNPSISLESTCSGCGKPLHTCTNCTFFNTGARFECNKVLTKRIESKSNANECTMFAPKTVRDLRVTEGGRPNDARAAFDALFKK